MATAIEKIQAAKAHASGADAQPPHDDEAADEARVYTVKELIEEAAVRSQSKERQERGTTGHHQIDKLTGGLRPGHSWVVAAESSWGKSLFVISVADENLKRGKRVLIVSFEDPRTIYADRLLCRRAQVNALRLRDRKLTADELERVQDVARRAEPVPVYIEAGNLTIEQLARQVEGLIRTERIDLVAWDYLQEAKTGRRYQDERVRFRETAALMRSVGRRTDCCTIIVSQITEQTGKKYPDKNSVRECRDVSNAAEHILIGFTPDENLIKDGRVVVVGGTKCIKIDKSKDGVKGTVAMKWNDESACFDADMPAHPAHDKDEWSYLDADEDADRRYP